MRRKSENRKQKASGRSQSCLGGKEKELRGEREKGCLQLGIPSRCPLGFNGFDQQRGALQDLGVPLLHQIISRYIPSISVYLRFLSVTVNNFPFKLLC